MMGVHLVGSLGLPDARTAFETVATRLGNLCLRLPDGEPGVRGGWLRWQEGHLRENPALDAIQVTQAIPGFINRDSVPRTFFRIRDEAESLSFPDLGYAREAIASFAQFASLRDQGVIDTAARFQISLPTAVGLACALFVPDSRAEAEIAFRSALGRELDAIEAAIPPDKLAIQWDVVFEVIGVELDSGLPYADPFAQSVARLAELCDRIHPDASVGTHFCYGDAGQKHIIEPTDLGLCVRFTAAISEAMHRPLDFVHVPVPVGRADPAYYEPLGALDLSGGIEIALGLVHDIDGHAGSLRRIESARRYVSDFAIATECGFGRRAPATVAALLDLHRDLCSGDAATLSMTEEAG
jgi:hypothetical protein